MDLDVNDNTTFDGDTRLPQYDGYQNDTTTLDWETCIMTSMYGILIIITVVGNTLIILVVLITKPLRTVTNYFITSLAVADWLVGVFVMPVAVAHSLTGAWEWGPLMCAVWVSCDVCLCTASILSLCAIWLDRYFAITWPLKYSKKIRSKKLALVMILMVWLLAFLITSPPLYEWYRHNKRDLQMCGYNQNPYYVVFSAMGSFFLPLVVMIYVFFKISFAVSARHTDLYDIDRQSQQRPQERSGDERSGDERSGDEDSDHLERSSSRDEVVNMGCCWWCRPGSNAGSHDNELPVRVYNPTQDPNNVIISSSQGERKTINALTIIVGGFIVCWLPFFCVYLANPFLPADTVPKKLQHILTWLGWLNSAINPFIYAFYNADFRLALWWQTFRRCATKQQQVKMFRSRTVRQCLYMKEFCVSAQNAILLNASTPVLSQPSSARRCPTAVDMVENAFNQPSTSQRSPMAVELAEIRAALSLPSTSQSGAKAAKLGGMKTAINQPSTSRCCSGQMETTFNEPSTSQQSLTVADVTNQLCKSASQLSLKAVDLKEVKVIHNQASSSQRSSMNVETEESDSNQSSTSQHYFTVVDIEDIRSVSSQSSSNQCSPTTAELEEIILAFKQPSTSQCSPAAPELEEIQVINEVV